MQASVQCASWREALVVCHWEDTFGRDVQFIASPAPTDWITQGNYHKSRTRFTFHFKDPSHFYILRASDKRERLTPVVPVQVTHDWARIYTARET